MPSVRIITPSKLTVTLVRAPDEDIHSDPSDVVTALAIKDCEIRTARRIPVIPNQPEWVILLTSAGTGAAIVQGIAAWVNGRNGRRYRIKDGDREFEAPSIKEIRKLIHLAKSEQLQINLIVPSENREK